MGVLFYETGETGNYTYTLVGIPSGEVFYINEIQLYNLYENDLIKFDGTKDKEFWYFNEKFRKEVELRIK